jgi:hypothetical protein
MSTFRNCTTPEEGWALIHHFLGNLLILIPMKRMDETNEPDEGKKYKYTRDIDDIWAGLLGKLYMIKRRMMSNTHFEDADKMQQLIDMIVELDLTNKEVCHSILEIEKELNPIMSSFEAELVKYKAEHEHVE